MALSDGDKQAIETFRNWLEQQLKGDSRFSCVARHDRDDQSTLATRWQATEHVWLEVAIRPLIPQIRVGVLTDDRWQNEEFEEKIEESGDTMPEFVEMGMSDAGLDWVEPPVEHYRADLKYFYFATPTEPKNLAELGSDTLRDKVLKMFNGYHCAFEPAFSAAEEG